MLLTLKALNFSYNSWRHQRLTSQTPPYWFLLMALQQVFSNNLVPEYFSETDSATFRKWQQRTNSLTDKSIFCANEHTTSQIVKLIRVVSFVQMNTQEVICQMINAVCNRKMRGDREIQILMVNTVDCSGVVFYSHFHRIFCQGGREHANDPAFRVKIE